MEIYFEAPKEKLLFIPEQMQQVRGFTSRFFQEGIKKNF
jgi:hypothetical protein